VCCAPKGRPEAFAPSQIRGVNSRILCGDVPVRDALLSADEDLPSSPPLDKSIATQLFGCVSRLLKPLSAQLRANNP